MLMSLHFPPLDFCKLNHHYTPPRDRTQKAEEHGGAEIDFFHLCERKGCGSLWVYGCRRVSFAKNLCDLMCRVPTLPVIVLD